MAVILIVDDLEPNRYMLEALLKGHGHEVLSATNGREALEKARAAEVDLIVTDILMPVMDGFNLCREWKADERLSRIPFIFYTATYTDQKDVDFGLSLGADLFLIKPMEPDQFIIKVNEILEKPMVGDRFDPEPAEESVYLQKYNQALIRKLEDKMLQLEAEVQVRREAEARLVRFKTAIENTDDIIILMDQAGVVEYVNPAYEKTTGESAEAVLGRRPEFLKCVSGDQAPEEGLEEVLDQGRVWPGHLSQKNRAGQTLETEAVISPIRDESGRESGCVAVLRDVTRQMALEKQLVQSQKMEAIGTLAGGIAHDFNNILGVITGYAQLAELTCSQGEKAAENLNNVLQACDRAKNLVDQILTFSRKAEKQKIAVDLVSLIKECHKFLRASIPSTIDVRANLEVDSAVIQADPVQIQQVLLNLGANALYAMNESGGFLEIRLRKIILDQGGPGLHPDLEPGSYFLVSMSDSGPGMDSETLSRVFEPFFTTKDRGEGTGLGLAVAHGIVTGHKGTINVYSELGRGSTFNVYLPVMAGEVRDAQKPLKTELPRGEERILFVDDERDLTNIGREMLQRLGYRVEVAHFGAEALELFNQAPEGFDLVISDLAMRGMTGTELAEEIKKISPETPIILCTGFGSYESEGKALAAGAARLMTKPLEFRELAQAVRDVLDSR